MTTHLLRVEAVNLGEFIDDTDELSTRRGGGLLALYSVRQLLETFSTPARRAKLKPVATGASIGLFEFDANDAGDAEALATELRDHFRCTGTLKYQRADGTTGHLPLSIGTFVVDVVQITERPAQDVQLVTAKNRWRQLQEPTVSFHGLWEQAKEECYYDCVRPAKQGNRLPKDRDNKESRYDVSESVLERHHYGRGQRQRFYRDELGKDVTSSFTNELAEIGNAERLSEKLAPTTTTNKLAVFYADGNSFGKIGLAKLAKGLAPYHDWSEQIQKHHQALLQQLLARALADDAWTTTDGSIRLETLLWGGDEIIWIVPGWKGWELAEFFFAAEHKVEAHDQPLTYSAGLVFCGTKTPIHNVVKLAKRLGDVAKSVGGGHRLAYEVLESFDDITSDFHEHRERALPKLLKAPDPRPDNWSDPLTLDPTVLKAVFPALQAVARDDDFPMRQLYMLLKAWRTGESIEKYEKRLNASKVKESLDVIRKHLGTMAWLHLLEMLPYIPEGDGT